MSKVQGHFALVRCHRKWSAIMLRGERPDADSSEVSWTAHGDGTGPTLSREHAHSQPGTVVRRPIKSGLILWKAQRQVGQYSICRPQNRKWARLTDRNRQNNSTMWIHINYLIKRNKQNYYIELREPIWLFSLDQARWNWTRNETTG